MWRAYTASASSNIPSSRPREAMHPMYVIRALGGGLFLVGVLIMAFNI